jgi:hypothetical protein
MPRIEALPKAAFFAAVSSQPAFAALCGAAGLWIKRCGWIVGLSNHEYFHLLLWWPIPSQNAESGLFRLFFKFKNASLKTGHYTLGQPHNFSRDSPLMCSPSRTRPVTRIALVS